ncbi:DUF459 domain-containing protein [Lentilitoribacter sp. EG35]|uniref:SGNH/GDSL hydrolase family protein n=1 Tax=Lentilitoribacter sp. EG35 TaxID=3234192 RepID=UPI00345FAF02
MGQLPKQIVYVLVFMLGLSVISVSLDILQIEVHAQTKTKKKSKSILQFLFGKKEKKVVKKKTRTKKRRKKSGGSASTSTAVLQKSEDAQVLLVMGDFMASGIADGLKTAYQKVPGVIVSKKTSGSSTIVRPDYYNWPVKSVEWITEFKPNTVVFNIGSNDRQDMTVNGLTVEFGKEDWWTEYRRRVSEMASTIRAQNVNLLWVGVPSFKYKKMTADILAFNGIYREEVEKVGGVFVDIWDGFVDVEGNFIYTGSDINGQQVRLRSSDGINLTTAGKRKIAFYVEKPAKRFLSTSADPFFNPYDGLIASPSATLEPVRDPRLATKTKVYAFTDPELDGGDIMLGVDQKLPDFKEKSPLDKLIETGVVVSAPTGRADDFAWKLSRDEPLRLDAHSAPKDTANN